MAISPPYDVVNPSGPTKPSSILVVSTLLPALAILAVLGRFNVRRMQKAGLKLDDWIMIPATLLVIGMGICGILGVHKKIFGYHSPKGELHVLDPLVTYEQKLYYSFQWIQLGALSAIKSGAIAFYRRIFCSHHKSANAFAIVCTVSSVIIALWFVGLGFGLGFECGTHLSSYWLTQAEYLKYCVSGGEMFVQAFVISNFALDLWILLLPIPKIFGLHTSTGRKFGLCGVFCLAAVGVAASLARMVSMIQEFHTAYSALGDFRLQITLIVFWSNLEASMCLLAVNLPSLWSYKNSQISPSRIVSSIRSAMSLQSLRSTRPHASIPLQESNAITGEARSSNSQSSMNKIFYGSDKVESFAAYDVEAQEHSEATPPGAIKIHSAVLQTRDPQTM